MFGVIEDFSCPTLSLDQRYGTKRPSVFFIQIDSEAMAPYLLKGDRVIVDRSLSLKNNHLATFYYQGQALCRQFIQSKQAIILKSFNPKVKDIIIDQPQDLELFGVVKAIIREL